ncbi:hypothetical protein MTO96_042971 [Rhipicephalus appendiculatus]
MRSISSSGEYEPFIARLGCVKSQQQVVTTRYKARKTIDTTLTASEVWDERAEPYELFRHLCRLQQCTKKVEWTLYDRRRCRYVDSLDVWQIERLHEGMGPCVNDMYVEQVLCDETVAFLSSFLKRCRQLYRLHEHNICVEYYPELNADAGSAELRPRQTWRLGGHRSPSQSPNVRLHLRNATVSEYGYPAFRNTKQHRLAAEQRYLSTSGNPLPGSA